MLEIVEHAKNIRKAKNVYFGYCRKSHANGRNKSQYSCVLLANNVASVCMGLKV